MVLMCAQLWHTVEFQWRCSTAIYYYARPRVAIGRADSAVLWVLRSSGTIRLLRCAAAW